MRQIQFGLLSFVRMSSLAINLQDVDTTRLFKNKEGRYASVRFFVRRLYRL